MSENNEPIFPRSMDDNKESNDLASLKEVNIQLCLKVLSKLSDSTMFEKKSDGEVYRFEKSYHLKIQNLLSEIYEIENDLEKLLSQKELQREVSLVYGPPPMNIHDDQSNSMPQIVACKRCGARYTEGIKFCGRCGSSEFTIVG